MKFTKKELKDMDKAAMKIFGMHYESLDEEDKDYIYCYCEENVW